MVRKGRGDGDDDDDHRVVKCEHLIFRGDYDYISKINLHDMHSSSKLQVQSNYTCSFCKRNFSSAQALGGHMNVHRRDRARLRSQQQQQPQLPPWLVQNPNLNPSSSSNDVISTHDSKCVISLKPRQEEESDVSARKKRKKKKGSNNDHVGEMRMMMKKKKKVVEFENGGSQEPTEYNIDLELRLGYA